MYENVEGAGTSIFLRSLGTFAGDADDADAACDADAFDIPTAGALDWLSDV